VTYAAKTKLSTILQNPKIRTAYIPTNSKNMLQKSTQNNPARSRGVLKIGLGLLCLIVVLLIVLVAGKKWRWRELLLCVVCGVVSWLALCYVVSDHRRLRRVDGHKQPTPVESEKVIIVYCIQPFLYMQNVMRQPHHESARFYLIQASDADIALLPTSENLHNKTVIAMNELVENSEMSRLKNDENVTQKFTFATHPSDKIIECILHAYSGFSDDSRQIVTNTVGELIGFGAMFYEYPLLTLDYLLTLSRLIMDWKNTKSHGVVYLLCANPKGSIFHEDVQNILQHEGIFSLCDEKTPSGCERRGTFAWDPTATLQGHQEYVQTNIN
jgi:hypothetical protein